MVASSIETHRARLQKRERRPIVALFGLRLTNSRSGCPYILSQFPMRHALIQRLLVTLCLVAFGLGQTVFASMGVWCTDATGSSRIEYACFKSAQGACLSPCSEPDVHATSEDHEDEPLSPLPCEDTPLGSQLSAARLDHSNPALELAFATFVVTILRDAWIFDSDESAHVIRLTRGRTRPPDSLTRLRSVILVV